MSSSPYAPAAKLLNKIWTQRKGLKTLAYNRKGELTCTKSTFAQCSHVLECKPLLDRLIKKGIPDIQVKNRGLLYILLYELLLGPNRSIRGGGALKRQLMAAEEKLRELLTLLQDEFPSISKGSGSKRNKTRVVIPRYVRVNTLKTTTQKVLESLRKAKVSSVFQDPHVPDLLVLPPTSQSRAQLQELVMSNQVILQDKSSCFSAFCLIHGFDGDLVSPRTKRGKSRTTIDFLDACAAPGNKTSHLAALATLAMESHADYSPQIHALDKSPDRFELLQRRMKELVGPKVKCHHLDFLQTSSCNTTEEITGEALDSSSSSHGRFSKVQAILLDPSCSGSGMTGNHQEANRDPTYCNDRIKAVSDFQLQALKHATCSTHYPNVQRVVYSTCSMYLQENEGVIQRFLAESAEDETWALIPPKCLSGWKRRGLPYEGLSKAQSDCLIRVHPEEDATNGFFVACLEKQATTTKNKKHKKASKMKVGLSLNEETDKGEIWHGIQQFSDVELYTNQFDDLRAQEETKAQEKDNNGGYINAHAAVVPESSPSTTDKKRKADSLKSDFQKSADTKNDPISRKRAKKLEWKRRQHERKVKRLESKKHQTK